MIFLSPSEILLRIVVLHRLKWTNRRTLQVPPRSISPSHLSVSLSLFILVAAPLRIKYSFGLHLMPLLENKKTWLRFDRRKIPPPPLVSLEQLDDSKRQIIEPGNCGGGRTPGPDLIKLSSVLLI